MTYAKPEVIRLGDALTLIQNTTDKMHGFVDAPEPLATIPAYDADE